MLRATHRLLRPGGRTVFTTIHLAPGLTGRCRREALDAGPRAVASRPDQRALLERAGFVEVEQMDVSRSYVDALRAWMTATDEHFDALAALEPTGELAQRQADRRVHLAAAERGLLRRSMLAGRRPGTRRSEPVP